MITFFYNTAPNPMKVALMLEECGLPYEAVPIDTRRGDQHSPGYVAINPNAKIPAIRDGEATVFDSNAILLYLAEKTGRFLPPQGDAARGDLLSWLFFVATGVGPFSGQAVHFRNFAPGENPYALKRYDFEARRHWQIVDDRLAGREWMLGDAYTIVDMAVWGWGSRLTYMLGDARIMERYPHLDRLMKAIDARPAAARAAALKERHAFKTELDDIAMRSLYPQIFAPDPTPRAG
jgi:GST-like protein